MIHEPLYYYRQRSSSMLKTTSSSFEELSYLSVFIKQLEFLLAKATSFDFSDQLNAYFLRLSSERTALCFTGKILDSRFLDNYELSKRSRVAIYSSGTFGRRLYATLISYGYNVIALYDEDFHESLIGNIDVLSPSKLDPNSFDCLLIAAWSISSIDHALDTISKYLSSASTFDLVTISRLNPSMASSLSSELKLLAS